jgi:LDH2 family malate/lactate/ureidoglycolate dehydrogenase
MLVDIGKARTLGIHILTKHGMQREHAEIVLDHLVDAALTGHLFAGPPRILAIVEMLKQQGAGGQIRILRENACSATMDGAGINGYVTCLAGIDKAIELAKSAGVGIVGLRNSWFSGRLAYYVERAAEQGLIALHAANSPRRVAPFGGIDPLLGTNPLAIAFPGGDQPLVIDFGTSALMWGEALLRQKAGRLLEENWAVDAEGYPTRDPTAALAGAFLMWGGHRGSGLSLAVALLSALAGTTPLIDDFKDSGFFFLVFDPALLMPTEEFVDKVKTLRAQIEQSRPVEGAPKIRMPGSQSQQRRAEGLRRGTIEIDDAVYQALVEL